MLATVGMDPILTRASSSPDGPCSIEHDKFCSVFFVLFYLADIAICEGNANKPQLGFSVPGFKLPPAVDGVIGLSKFA